MAKLERFPETREMPETLPEFCAAMIVVLVRTEFAAAVNRPLQLDYVARLP